MIPPLTTTTPNDRRLMLVRAIENASTVTFVYTDSDGVVSIRTANPTAIRRCLNGNTCVVAYDLQRQAPRCFNINRIGGMVEGDGFAFVTLI